MGGVEGNQWFDKFMDEVGLVFTKVDESIQKVSTLVLLVWSLFDVYALKFKSLWFCLCCVAKRLNLCSFIIIIIIIINAKYMLRIDVDNVF